MEDELEERDLNESTGWVEEFITDLMMMVSGGLMVMLPFTTWPNSKLLAIFLSPAIPLGALLTYGGATLAWNDWRNPRA